jgi:hypothetical protein
VTHQLIASPYPEGHLVVRPGHDGAIRIGAARYAELRDAPAGAALPSWLAEVARAGWRIDLAGRTVGGTILVRPETGYGYARASYELNLGCNYGCIHLASRLSESLLSCSSGTVLVVRSAAAGVVH